MADRSLFERKPGTFSGRIEPSGWTAPGGSHVFVLGSDDPGWTGFFGPIDSIRATQSDTYGAALLLRFRGRLRGPTVAPPDGWSWEAYAIASGSTLWVRTVEVGRTIDIADTALSTRGLAGSVDLEIGLRVVGPSGADPVELEIPAFYVDDLTLDDEAETIVVANRVPEPDEVGVSRQSAIIFDLIETGASDVNSNILITVDGVLAYDGLGIGAQPGYSVSITGVGNAVKRIEIEVPYDFDSLRVVPIRVEATNDAGTASIDETWSFTIVDETAPRVVSAVSIAHDIVRITFDEPVSMEDPASSSDALNPELYSFAYTEAPAVSVEPVSVASVDDRTVDVTLDIPITRGVIYTATVEGVVDELGNEIAAPYNTADFAGYQCEQPEGRDFGLWDWIPRKNREEDTTRDLFKFVAVCQEVAELLLCDVDRWTEIIDVDIAAERYLDHMLIQLGNPFTTFDLSVEDKRRLIRVLVSMYRQKGTGVGIVNVVRFFVGIEVTIRSFLSEGWILGDDELGETTYLAASSSRERYSFEVISPVVLTQEEQDRIAALVDYMKPAHTHHVRTVEPTIPDVIDHVELGLSELAGDEWALH